MTTEADEKDFVNLVTQYVVFSRPMPANSQGYQNWLLAGIGRSLF
jgi:hypothetical protein